MGVQKITTTTTITARESSAEEIEAAEMKKGEQYVMGMLTNFPSMPIERIHNMLKMFVVEPKRTIRHSAVGEVF